MATQVQNRRGTTAEHSTFTGANGELTVDTTKRTLVVHDGATAGGRPLLREDQSNLPTSAPTTGIYNASGSLAISTNSVGRLFVDASGRVGVGTASPGENLSIGGGANLYASLTSTGGIKTALAASDANGFGWAGSTTNHAFTLFTNNAERLRITSAGLVGVGTSTPAWTFDCRGSANFFIENGFLGLDAQSSPRFGFVKKAGASPILAVGSATAFQISHSSSTDISGVSGNTYTPRLTIDTSGNVGIGTTSPQTPLHVSTANAEQGRFESTGASYINVKGSAGQNLLGVEPGAGWVGPIESIALAFKTGNAERARIDSSGRLLVGTSSSTAVDKLQVVGNATGSTYPGSIFLKNGLAVASILTDYEIGAVKFGGGAEALGASIVAAAESAWTTAGSGDYPTRLVFSTTADGASSPTERVRITEKGAFKASNSGAYTGATAAYHEFYQTQNAVGLLVRATSGSLTSDVLVINGDRATTDATYNLLNAYNGAVSGQFIVRDSGNAVNTNNSYGSISDRKLKENIVDASSQWSDIKALQVRKYNFKEGQTHTQIGLVAQEVELVSPGLVSESPDRDTEGNDLGTVTKSVNYSVLYMKAVKALQEAMERIESLESEMAAVKAQLA